MCLEEVLRVVDSEGSGDFVLVVEDGVVKRMERVGMDVIPAEVFSV